jgi:hypothetical protein
MEHQIKKFAEVMTNSKAQHLIKTHVRSLLFENNHLIIFVDNTAPLHEFNNPEMDVHLNKGIGEIYGEDITYEFKLNKPENNDKKEELGQQHNFNLMHDRKKGRK